MSPELRVGNEIIAQIVGDREVCETPVGMIGVELRVDPETNLHEVILDCTRSPLLQGSRERKVRRIALGRDGVGSQQISSEQTVEYRLGYRVRPLKPWKGMGMNRTHRGFHGFTC